MNLSLPGLALAHQLYIALKAQGHGCLGTQALILALEQLNGAALFLSVSTTSKHPPIDTDTLVLNGLGIYSEKANNVELV